MYEYDEYNPKKKDEYEETEQESIAYSADGMEDEPHVDGESIEMEAEVISGEEYTEEISGEQFSEEESFSEQESVSEANTEEGAEKAEAFTVTFLETLPLPRTLYPYSHLDRIPFSSRSQALTTAPSSNFSRAETFTASRGFAKML